MLEDIGVALDLVDARQRTNPKAISTVAHVTQPIELEEIDER